MNRFQEPTYAEDKASMFHICPRCLVSKHESEFAEDEDKCRECVKEENETGKD